MLLGNIAFHYVLFVLGLLQTLISEPQLEKLGCKIVSEHGIRIVSRNGVHLFHATLEYNSYIFKPTLLPTSSRLLQSEEIVLAANVVPSTSADLWHLNFPDMCKLRSKATGIDFVGEPCSCQKCVIAK